MSAGGTKIKSKTPIPELVSMLDPARPSHQWLQRIILRARAYLDLICQQLRRELESASEVGDIPDYPEAEHLCRVIHLATHAERAIEQGDAVGAATAAMGAIQAAWQAELVQGRVVVADGFKKRTGDKNRTKEVVRIRKKQAQTESKRHPEILAAVAEAERKMPSATRGEIYEKVGKDFGKSWGTVRNIVSEAKKAAK